MPARTPLLVVVAAIAAGPALAADAAPPDAPVADAAPADAAPAEAPAAPSEAVEQPAPPPVLGRKLTTADLPPPNIGTGGLSDLIGPLIKTFVMLGVVLALVYLSLHKGLGKLVERQNAGKRVKVVERTPLDQKRSVFVVEVDGKQMVIAAGEGGIVKLGDLEPKSATPPASGERRTGLGARFVDALAKKTDGPPPVTGVPRTSTTEGGQS